MITKDSVLAAVRECLYGECKNCPFVRMVDEHGSRTACRLELLSQVENVLSVEEVEE